MKQAWRKKTSPAT